METKTGLNVDVDVAVGRGGASSGGVAGAAAEGRNCNVSSVQSTWSRGHVRAKKTGSVNVC